VWFAVDATTTGKWQQNGSVVVVLLSKSYFKRSLKRKEYLETTDRYGGTFAFFRMLEKKKLSV
jgi:hypothetical protein